MHRQHHPSSISRSTRNTVRIIRQLGKPSTAPDRHYAKACAPRAPSTRREEWRNRPRVMTGEEMRDSHTMDRLGCKFLPSINHLQVLHKSSLIMTEPSVALVLLDRLRDLGSGLDGPSVRKLCIEYSVPLDDLTYIARICLGRTFAPAIRTLGKAVMLASSANEVPKATLYLLRAAVRQDKERNSLQSAYSSNELAPARQHLKKLVERNHPVAMVFYATRLAASNKMDEAISLIKEALDSNATRWQQYGEDAESLQKTYSGHFLMDSEVSKEESPWTTLARFEMAVGNSNGAEEAFCKAAHEHDDPYAYQALTDNHPRFSRTWLEYMTKAAASASWTAARALGHFYSTPLGDIPDPDLRLEMQQLEQRDQKIEWWYYYLDDAELQALEKMPGTKLIRADFWRLYREPEADPALQMVELNQRQALAMEWYEVAFRGQTSFSQDRNPETNEAMQRIVRNASRELPPSAEWKPSDASRRRHHDMHHALTESVIYERFITEFQELKRQFWG